MGSGRQSRPPVRSATKRPRALARQRRSWGRAAAGDAFAKLREKTDETNRTRRSLTRAGMMFDFPIAREDFEKSYLKYLEGTRRRE